jgi:pimeloyl-ACP methyl ester carboxylesterase
VKNSATPARAALAAALALLAAACLPSAPVKTTRPAVEREPFTEMAVRSGSGHTYRYLHAPGPGADAPVMLLLPGGIFDSRIWLYAGDLAARFEIVVLDWPDNSLFYSGRVEDFGEVAADFLQTLGVSSFHLGGVSMGTFAAIDLASRKADRFEVLSLALASSAMFAITEEEIEGRTGMAGKALGFAPEKLRGVVEWSAGRAEYDPAPGEVQQADVFYARPYSYYHQVFGMAWNQGDRPQDTGAIRCPVLFLHGTEDETFPVDVARLNPTVFTNAKATRWVEIEGGRHSMVFSHGPRVAAEILAFLDEQGF